MWKPGRCKPLHCNVTAQLRRTLKEQQTEGMCDTVGRASPPPNRICFSVKCWITNCISECGFCASVHGTEQLALAVKLWPCTLTVTIQHPTHSTTSMLHVKELIVKLGGHGEATFGLCQVFDLNVYLQAFQPWRLGILQNIQCKFEHQFKFGQSSYWWTFVDSVLAEFVSWRTPSHVSFIARRQPIEIIQNLFRH